MGRSVPAVKAPRTPPGLLPIHILAGAEGKRHGRGDGAPNARDLLSTVASVQPQWHSKVVMPHA